MKQTKEEAFEYILCKLEDRLDVTGEITTDQAWQICKGGYSKVTFHFRKIMELMVEQGKAVKIRNGLWKILKPNRSKKIIINNNANNK